MIIYQLKSSSTRPNKADKQPLPRGQNDPKTEQGRRAIFLKSLKYNKYQEGMRVRLKGASAQGTITNVIREIEKIEWTSRNIPLFIEVFWDDGGVNLYAPYQLTCKGVKNVSVHSTSPT